MTATDAPAMIDRLEAALGKYVRIDGETEEPDELLAGMEGWLWLIEEDAAGTWAVVDYGYGMRIDSIEDFRVLDPPPDDAGLPMWIPVTCSMCDGTGMQSRFLPAPAPCPHCNATGMYASDPPQRRRRAQS